MVPDVEWPVELDILPAYLQLCNAFMGCFVSVTSTTSQDWQLALLAQERALAYGKALVHLCCNRLYLEFKSTRRFHSLIDYRLASLFACLQRDCSDQSTALVCDIGYILFGQQYNQFPRVPDTCPTWVLHLFPHLLDYLVWDPSVTQRAVEVTICMVTRPFPPRKILADCLLSAAIVMGIDVDTKELVKIDKGPVARMLLRRILQILPTSHRITEAPMNVESHAMRLLQPLSLCFDAGINPGFGRCKSKQCGCEVMEWALHTCQSMVGKLWSTNGLIDPNEAMSKEERSEVWRTARGALHLSASLACCGLDEFGYAWTRWHPSYGGHRRRPVIDGPDWSVRFLNEHYDARDPIAVADTFTVLSQARDIHQWADSPALVGAIIHAMGPDQPTQVRHTALRAACEIRNAPGFPKDAIHPMAPGFIVALRSAVMTNLDPPDNTTNTKSPDRFAYEERDLCYLQIIYTLTQNSDGVYDDHLRDAGHFDRCLDVAQHTKDKLYMLSLYLIAIVETLEARDAEHAFIDALDLDLRSEHHGSAWVQLAFLPTNQIQEHEQALPAVIASLRKCREKTNVNQVSRGWVQKVHDKLQGYNTDTPVVSLLAGLLASWPKDEMF
ncbi:hypothetical protein BV22DRAFT_634631 [Leucogyrophana mollusca]|uniref:Uncharacterized protein n=1 Tax=Leucogyrophana mollusca TaxID=85980 RepID=A0ACB8BAM8_9AGAM|nr:hypothetical protein BV22DRAFT_634631 [Leucogyrophana mollusca]